MVDFERRIPRVAPELSRVRRALRGWLDAVGVPDERAGDVLVVVSELVTNGVLHDGGDLITLRADKVASEVEVEVVTTNSPPTPARALRADWRPDERGRGMGIVAALADQVAVTADDDRRSVRCRLPLG